MFMYAVHHDIFAAFVNLKYVQLSRNLDHASCTRPYEGSIARYKGLILNIYEYDKEQFSNPECYN